MLDRETLITLFEGANQSIVFNLDFIPADKLTWKPAPEAKSALEIVNHLGAFLGRVAESLQPGANTFAPTADAQSAKRELATIGAAFVAALRGASAETLAELFHADMGFSKGWIVTGAVIDALHHGGQIAYIQTLLGDNEIHFDPEVFPNWVIG